MPKRHLRCAGRMNQRTVPFHVLAPVALALLAGCTLSACSSAPDGSSTSSPSADSAAERALAYGACLRDAGFDVSDDDLVAGRLAIPDGADPEAFARASDACDATSAAAHDGAGAAEESAEPLDLGPGFVRCVRDAGFPDFPDEPEAQAAFEPADPAGYDRVWADCAEAAGAGPETIGGE